MFLSDRQRDDETVDWQKAHGWDLAIIPLIPSIIRCKIGAVSLSLFEPNLLSEYHSSLVHHFAADVKKADYSQVLFFFLLPPIDTMGTGGRSQECLSVLLKKKMARRLLSIIHCANALRPRATKYWELAAAMPLADFIPFKRSRQSPILPRCYLALNQVLTRANFVH